MAMFILLIWFFPAMAADVRVAVAANFMTPIQAIAPGFERVTGHHLVLSYGSTGKFYAQIHNGAPFDLLLAADDSTPARLESEGHAVSGSRFTYAIGKLVLWSADPKLVDKQGKVLHGNRFRHIALANPKLAPYGMAGLETMKTLGVYETLQNKIVLGENITQAQQFIASGNAELGFVALSQILPGGKFSGGSYWEVPGNLYRPIRQDAVILNQGAHKPAVDAFAAYLKSPGVRKIIRTYGYELQ